MSSVISLFEPEGASEGFCGKMSREKDLISQRKREGQIENFSASFASLN